MCLKDVIFDVWCNYLEINISDDEDFCTKYEAAFNPDEIPERCELIDRKLRAVLCELVEGVKKGLLSDELAEGIKSIIGPGRTMPKVYFHDYEIKRLSYHFNLILNKYGAGLIKGSE